MCDTNPAVVIVVVSMFWEGFRRLEVALAVEEWIILVAGAEGRREAPDSLHVPSLAVCQFSLIGRECLDSAPMLTGPSLVSICPDSSGSEVSAESLIISHAAQTSG